MIEIGDYVALMHPVSNKPLKKGIVIKSKDDDFVVKWTSYDKFYFLDPFHKEIEDLNRRYLLTEMSYNRDKFDRSIEILSKASKNEMG
jgi:hypothetical protein